MLLLFDMGGILPGFPNSAPVGPNFLSNILSFVPKGDLRHNEICDLTAKLLTDVGHEVQVELPMTGEKFH